MMPAFDHLGRRLEPLTKTEANGYPPYNIEQVSETRLRITLAAAGFSEADLSVSLENNTLVVRGARPPSGTDSDLQRVYLHRGIASRPFQRAFVLAEGIEISGAMLENGLLHVDLERPLTQSKVRMIPIETGQT